MGIIIKKKQKNKIKNIKKQRSLKLLSKKLQNKKTQNKNKNKNKKLKAQNKNKKLLKTKTKTQNQKNPKKQRRTHLSSTSPKICSRCPNFKKQEKHNCHFFGTLKE